MDVSRLAKSIFAAALFCAFGAAEAAPVTYQFTATNFTSSRGYAAPQQTVAGAITINGNTLVGMNIAIGSHQFKLSEVGYSLGPGSSIQLGATSGNGYNGFRFVYSDIDPVGYSYDDFLLYIGSPGLGGYAWNPTFQYSVATIGDIFTANTVTAWNPAVVPVPAAAWLFGCGLAGLVGFRRARSPRLVIRRAMV